MVANVLFQLSFFEKSKESLQETTSFNLVASQHRLERGRNLKADNPLGSSPLKIVHLAFYERFNGRHNKYSGAD